MAVVDVQKNVFCRRHRQWIGGIIRILPVVGLFLLGGCSDLLLLDPKGPIGETERFVILTAFALMLLVVIPVIIMAFWFPRRYRAENHRSDYAPKWSYSLKIELIIWLVPAAIITILSFLIYNTTHQVDPYKPIASTETPVRVQAVSLDWQWLFIYPEENIAVMNHLVFPARVPLNLQLTSETVMTSFFIPQLGSQIYAMAGMQTRLHLLANEIGTYAGHNQQFSGEGYASMRFSAVATTPEQYTAWLAESRKASQALDMARYEELIKPTTGAAVRYFSSVEPGLFDTIIRKYNHSYGKKTAAESNATELIWQNNMVQKGH